MKMKRPNTPDLPLTKMNTTDLDKVKVPLSVKVCNRFGPMCQFCKQSAPYHSPPRAGWTDKDWNGKQTKTQKPAGDINLMSDWDLPSSQYNPNSKLEEFNKINIDKLGLDPDNPQEEPLQVTNSLIPPPMTEEADERLQLKRRQMLGQTMTNKGEKKTTRKTRKSMWDNLAMRRVIQIQTYQTSVIMLNKDIFRVCILLIQV